MRTTTPCPGCQAPVSVGEPVCWSCGGRLSRPPSPAAAPPAAARRPLPPGPFSRTCPTCNETIALYHRSCPVCGQTGTPATVALAPPSGWTETLLADGTVQLERIGAGRSQKVMLTLIIAGLLLFSGLGELLDGRRRPGQLPPDAEWVVGLSTAVILICMAGLVAACLAWVWTGRERWTIRNGLLEIRRDCLGRQWSRGYSATDLSLEPDTYVWSPNRLRTWRLIARGMAADQTLATSTAYGVYGMNEFSALGTYLSARTGWRWHPPQDLPLLTSLFGPRGW